MLTFSPANGARSGQTVTIAVNTRLTLTRAEVFVSNPNETPTGDLGWTKVGEVAGGSGQIAWGTTGWAAGRYAFTVVGYSGSAVALHPFQVAGVRSPIIHYELLAPAAVSGPAPQPVTPSPSAPGPGAPSPGSGFSFGKWLGDFFQHDPVPATIAMGVVAVLGWKMLNRE